MSVFPRNFIIIHTFFSGTAAMRNTKRGSWYIEALTSVFAEDSRDTHVADMLVKVSWSVFPTLNLVSVEPSSASNC